MLLRRTGTWLAGSGRRALSASRPEVTAEARDSLEGRTGIPADAWVDGAGPAEGGGGPEVHIGSKIVGYPILAFILGSFAYTGYRIATGTNEPWTDDDFRLPTHVEIEAKSAAMRAEIQASIDAAAAAKTSPPASDASQS
ncbi:uncharacterized protein AMSG_00200 [Thecamonas trahens ATCC 50062]|uniref:Uncharacterized protein n=1 Tax=Thecamonas trahens ATCC 50062 TaxID=461836 RepID=A0A0L0D1H3_THETB|nr:hypothetical protein AMSG_00200 [Thecamonas trahens ATCC 50062]KNC46082.1 hypothetical protein AMSG_00200 [Thecamonas trahens ATCC 50062]|eukprot:XP_013763062.1 hypothetical protein AMSG_00200 [Thecamonas trahens ATCC 50062]